MSAIALDHRLQPAHYEIDRVPAEVAGYGPGGGHLPVGSPGKVGVLELDFEVRTHRGGPRTELTHHYQKSPLQIMRPLYYDQGRPDIPYTYVMTTGGGVLQGDRQRMDLRFGPGSASHVTTQAHTKIYRMEHGYAASQINLMIEAGAYAEFLPDPVIPYANSRFYQRVRAVVHPDATAVLGETVYAGRLSRGERGEYDVYAADLEVLRPDGSPLLLDRVRLVPSASGPAGIADRDIMASLYVISPLQPAGVVADRLHEALAPMTEDGTLFGVSVLPADCGAWVRILGDDTVQLQRLTTTAWQVTRELLLGVPAPRIRK
ncbi:urease accessory protein [Branchiibius hedensis]|uniref:Urease accessory protein UreD n=1 Tax=Branchiibius hedensis TaxID=672460 RepID=A0A2Y9A1B8_9MICO|nr:urease accessory protein UreD [Branchiibius hedensis]PWJ27479.1 urease accessory protein [Branchiibius hedensis]SSA36289.1 urease accessory protein [Branchiibius hedensis]